MMHSIGWSNLIVFDRLAIHSPNSIGPGDWIGLHGAPENRAR